MEQNADAVQLLRVGRSRVQLSDKAMDKARASEVVVQKEARRWAGGRVGFGPKSDRNDP